MFKKKIISITYSNILFLLVVTQFYDTDVNKAYAIRGNSVIIKCETPSYVTDFLSVVSWHTDNGDVYYPGDNNGIIFGGVHYLNLIKIGFIIEIASVSYLIFRSTTPNNMNIKLNFVCVYSVLIIYFAIAVSQYYEVDVNKEPVIKGNSVIMKCGIPSFVADFVIVLSWSTDKGDNFYPGIDYGILCSWPCIIYYIV